MALFSVIHFDGLRSRDWLIYKFPSDSLVLGSQLMVQEGQAAGFFGFRCLKDWTFGEEGACCFWIYRKMMV